MTSSKFFSIVSIVFHPIVLPTAATLFVFIVQPNTLSSHFKLNILGLVAVFTYAIPILLLYVLKKTKRIHSYDLKEIHERKSPILTMLVLFYILATLFGEIVQLHSLATLFTGCSISLSLCYIAFAKNIKTSIHMIGAASASTFLLTFSHQYQCNLLLPFAISCFCGGLISQARLRLEAHTIKEIIFGIVFGILGQLVAYSNVLIA